MTSYEIVTWGDSVGDHWPCLVRVFNPATFPDGFPVRWSDLAPGVDLARASWESATGRSYRSGVGASLAPWEPEEGPECPHSRVPLMRVLLALATGAVWVGQWDGYGGRRRPSPAQHLTTHKGVLRSYDVVEVTEELRRALEDPADPPMLPNRMWDEGGTFQLDADIDLPSMIVGCTERIAAAIEADPDLESVRVDHHDPLRL